MKCLLVSIVVLMMFGCNYLVDPGAMLTGSGSIFTGEDSTPPERGAEQTGGVFTVLGSENIQGQGDFVSQGYVLMIQGEATTHYTVITTVETNIGIMIAGSPTLTVVLSSLDGKLQGPAVVGTAANGGNYWNSAVVVTANGQNSLNGSDKSATMTFVKGTTGLYKMRAQGWSANTATNGWEKHFDQTFEVTVTK